MNYRIHYRSSVREELAEIEEWYDKKEEGLSARFRIDLDKTLKRIQRLPFIAPQIDPEGIRRIEMGVFPYAVFYALEEEVIVVLGVLHKRRSQDRWPRSSSS